MRDLFGNTSRTRDSPPHFSPSSHTDSQADESASRAHQHQRPRGRHDDPEPSDSDDSSSTDAETPRRPTLRRPRGRHSRDSDDSSSDETEQRKTRKQTTHRQTTVSEPQFDHKLKIDIIPQWDGDADTLGRWIIKVNELSDRSTTIFKQLGQLVPSRLKGGAETWYYSQSARTRAQLERNWETLREGIGAYYMNRAFMDKQKARANRATFRDISNTRESPSEYFIRKKELLEFVYDYTDGEIINEIMNGAPTYWTTILTPHLYNNIEEFQIAIKFHEDNLVRMDSRNVRFDNSPIQQESYPQGKQFQNFRNARTNLVGWSKNTATPEYPKDDTNISPRATPEDKGARPCRHCGSSKHWDPECKYARKGERKARTNLITTNSEENDAQELYNEMYYALPSEDEYESAREDF